MSLHELESVDDPDALFDALSDSRRRAALRSLATADSPVALADLAVEVAARELDDPIPAVEQEHVDRVRTSLYHVHVPKLARVGLVEYDPVRRTVALDAPAPAVDRLVELILAASDRSND